jgi:hypothetical protein
MTLTEFLASRPDLNSLPLDQTSAQKIAEIASAEIPRTVIKSTMVSARSILGAYGAAGATILDKLETAGQVNPACKWACRFLAQEGGLDVGHPTTQAMIGALVVANVLTNDEADMLKFLAQHPEPYTVSEIESIRNV